VAKAAKILIFLNPYLHCVQEKVTPVYIVITAVNNVRCKLDNVECKLEDVDATA